MNFTAENPVVQLSRSQLVRFVAGGNATVRCVRGSLWITQDGNPQDLVIQPGEVFTADSNAALLVYALQDNSLLAIRGASTVQVPSRWHWLTSRLHFVQPWRAGLLHSAALSAE